MSFSAKSHSPAKTSLRRLAAQRKPALRKDFRRAFLEQLESRQVMTALPVGDDGFTGKVLDSWDGTKVTAADPRVQAWESAPFVNDSFLVRFNPGVTRTDAEATIAVEAPGASIKTWDAESNYAWINLPVDSTRQEVLDASHHFLELSNTLYAEPNFTYEARRVPNDPAFPAQWNMNNTGQLVGDSLPPTIVYPGIMDVDIDAPEAWDITTGSPNTVIAVLDTGYNRFEVDRQPGYWVNPGETYNGRDDDGNGVIDDVNGYDAAMDDGDPQDDVIDEHGMFVASVAAAPGDDMKGMTGVSWNSKVMFVKCVDDNGNFTSGGIVGGINYTTKMKYQYGINIVAVNMSFGGPTFSFAQFDALQNAGNRDLFLVAAAANQGYNHDILFDSPTGYNVDQIIAVTAHNARDDQGVVGPGYIPGGLPDFGYGAVKVDIAAPGIHILLSGFRLPGQLWIENGTSFAAPHVAGVAALMKSVAPYLTALDLKQMIISSAERVPYLTNLNVANGRLNAFNALSAIPKTTISGTVFQDANNDKLQNPAETGLGGWTVYLDLDNDGVFDTNEPSTTTVTTATTNGPAIGSYTFDAYLDVGTYRVRQVVQTGFTQTTPTGNGPHVITVGARGQDFANLNFGDRMTPGTIVGRKFLDLDGNGALDTGEGGLAGILFYVDLNNNGRINVGEPGAYTDAQGYFTIPGIQPGMYQVREILTPGYFPTLPNTVGANGIPDPVLPVTVVSNTSNTPPLLFGNRVARDWGDLPETLGGAPAYRTTSANNGPSHGFLPGFMLGTRQDFEANGLPSSTARGDDLNPSGALSDEDGLTNIALVQGTQGTLSLTVTNIGRSPGVIQGWVDFNADGDFADDGEQILKNFAPVNGANNNIPFTVPTGVTPGVTYARFRYAYERDLGPTGPARAGEVEDYQITIFSALPTARDDRFPEQLFPPPNDPAFINDPLIKQESVNNVLNVLRNDPAPATGTLSIASFTDPPNGTLTLSTVGGVQVLLYTPNSTPFPFTGVDTFKYRVTNGTDVSPEATVQVRVTAKDPRSVDNTYTFAANVVGAPAQSYAMDVLTNDVNTPSAPISLINFTQPTYPGVTVTGPTVTQNGSNLIITPPAGFIGSVQFQYTITDTDPTTVDSTSLVTVQLTGSPPLPPAPGYLAMISVEVVDARGNIKGIDPAFRIDVGEAYYVQVYSEDLRQGGDATNRGVEAAFLDLLYDRRYSEIRFIEVPAGSGTFRPETYFDDDPDDFLPTYNALLDDQYNFDQNKAGFNSPEGIYQEIGAAHSGNAPLGKGRVPLMVVGLNATAATPAGGTRITPDPAEDSSGRSDIGLAPELNDPNYPSPIPVTDLQVYLQESPLYDIKVPGAPEFINERDALDVNADAKISAFDALSVVNELNLHGARGLGNYELSLGGGMPPAGFVDTNGDGKISAFDALGIINWLNQHPTSTSGAGEFTGGSGGEFTGSGSSAGESIEGFERGTGANGSSAEESSSSSTSSSGASSAAAAPTARPTNSGSGSSQTSVTARSNQSSAQNDSQLVYRSAVDQLMAQAGDKETGHSTVPTASATPVTDLLQQGNRLKTILRMRSGVRR